MRKLKQWIPSPAKSLLRRQIQIIKRRTVARRVTKEELVSEFQAMGLRSGDTVMVHSSLSKMGFVVGGPATVIESLLQVVGDEGMVVMPSFPPMGGVTTLDYLAANPCFDPQHTPSRTGKITEIFRLWPGAERSIHPTHPLAAVGPNAKDFVQGHFNSITPFGPDTPFHRLLEQDAWILGLGIGIELITFYHVFEDKFDPFPVPVYYSQLQRARVLIEQREHEVWTRVHDPRVGQFRINKDQRVKAVVAEKLLDWGFLGTSKIGDGWSFIIKTGHLMTALERMLNLGITIYNTERMQKEGWVLPDNLADKI